jgi:hypothetical protein
MHQLTASALNLTTLSETLSTAVEKFKLVRKKKYNEKT